MFGLGSKDEDNAAREDGRNFHTLREANIARQAEWDPSDKVDLSWRCNELAGEAGEVCNVLKKLHRERVGLPGSRATKDQLAEELADTVICVDLAALTAGLGPVEPYYLDPRDPRNQFEHASLTDRGNALAARAGAVCETVFTIDVSGNRGELKNRLRLVQLTVMAIAATEGIDLQIAVANKFNATTHRMGLMTFLRYEGD